MLESDDILGGLKDIMRNLLTVNPYFRWTASECLSHPVFDDIRESDHDLTANKKLKLVVDSDDAFNYETGSSNIIINDIVVSSIILEAEGIH